MRFFPISPDPPDVVPRAERASRDLFWLVGLSEQLFPRLTSQLPTRHHLVGHAVFPLIFTGDCLLFPLLSRGFVDLFEVVF